mgnify:CR=1 FL=1
MTEFEICSLQKSNYINSIMCQVCIILGVFIAFNLAWVANEMGRSIVMERLATLSGFNVVYFNFGVDARRVDIFQGMAA